MDNYSYLLRNVWKNDLSLEFYILQTFWLLIYYRKNAKAATFSSFLYIFQHNASFQCHSFLVKSKNPGFWALFLFDVATCCYSLQQLNHSAQYKFHRISKSIINQTIWSSSQSFCRKRKDAICKARIFSIHK